MSKVKWWLLELWDFEGDRLFADARSITRGEFMDVGGVWLNEEQALALAAHLQRWAERNERGESNE